MNQPERISLGNHTLSTLVDSDLIRAVATDRICASASTKDIFPTRRDHTLAFQIKEWIGWMISKAFVGCSGGSRRHHLDKYTILDSVYSSINSCFIPIDGPRKVCNFQTQETINSSTVEDFPRTIIWLWTG